MLEQISTLNNNILSRIGGMSQQLTNEASMMLTKHALTVVVNLVCSMCVLNSEQIKIKPFPEVLKTTNFYINHGELISKGVLRPFQDEACNWVDVFVPFHLALTDTSRITSGDEAK